MSTSILCSVGVAIFFTNKQEMFSKKKTGQRLIGGEDYSQEMEMIYTIECILYDIYLLHERI